MSNNQIAYVSSNNALQMLKKGSDVTTNLKKYPMLAPKIAIMTLVNNAISNSKPETSPSILGRKTSMSAQVREGCVKIHAAQHSYK